MRGGSGAGRVDGRLLAALGTACIVLAIFGPPDWPSLPRWEDGVRSFANHSGFNPLSVYLHFAVRLLLCTVGTTLIVLALRGRTPGSPGLASRATALPGRHPGLTGGLLFAMGMATLGLSSPGQPLWDMFHEGEWLELIPTIKAHPDDWYLRVFMIHGYGVDALPAWISARFWPEGHQVAGARSVRLLVYIPTMVALWLVLREAVRHRSSEVSGALVLLGAGLVVASWDLLWTWGGDTFVNLPLRRTVLFFQIALALLVLPPMGLRRGLRWAAFAAAGALVGISPAWNIGDSPTGLVAVAAALGITAVLRPREAAGNGAAALAGGAASAGALHLAMPGVWAAIAEMLAYWSLYGRSIWMHAPIDYLLSGHAVWVTLIGHALLITLVLLRLHRVGLRALLHRDSRTVLLLLVSLASARSGLDIGMPRGFSAMNLFLVLAGLSAVAAHPGAVSRWIGQAVPSLRRGTNHRLASLALVSALLGCGALVRASPWTIPPGMTGVVAATLRPPADASLLDEKRSAMRTALLTLTAGERCTVLVAPQSAWYHLLGVPSCSRWHTALQASAPAAQAELLETIVRERPGFVFTEVDDHLDGPADLSPRDRLPILFAGLRDRYEPMEAIGSLRPWRLLPAR